MSIQDEKILSLVKNLNTLDEGFNLLMNTYQKRLYHHIRSIVNIHDDTDDILQNTLIKVFKNINKFEGRSNLYTWLYRIATNEATSFLKKNNRKNRFVDNLKLESVPISFEDDNGMNGEFIKNMLHKAINELPDKQKIVFSLRYFEEMSYKEMSEVLGTSIGALKASYHHAVKKIEKFIKQVGVY